MSGVTKRIPEKRPSKDNSNPCAQCGLHIEDPYLLDALNNSWHITCFCCEECSVNLPDYYCENAGRVYCFDDYCKKFGFKCEKCQQCIIGPTMTAGSTRKYHPECFICMSCEIPVGEKDSYSLLDTGVLLCQDCYVVERNARNSTLSHGCRVVRMVKVLVTNSKPVKFKLDGLVPSDGKCSLKVQRLPEHLQPEQYGHLEKGDKILEINGVPIKNQDQSEINRLTSLSGNDYIHLTVERKCDHAKAVQKTRSVPVNAATLVTPPTPSNDVTDSPSPWGPTPPRRTRVSSYTSPRYRPTTIHVSSPMLRVVRPMTPQHPQRIKADVSRRSSLKLSSEEMGPLQCFRHSDLEIGEVLGQGFFGRVLKVTHKTTGQVMVMKEMVRCTDESKTSFLKEVTLLKALDHPNVLRFIGILFQPGKLLTLITEYADGGTVRQKIKRLSEPFPWSLRVQIARDIAAGMVYLHEQNVIHRDLNSKNCLLRKDMSAVVADFGLARHFQPAIPTRQTWGGRRQKESYDESDYAKQVTRSPKHESRPSSNSSTPTKKGVRRRMTVVGSAFWMAPEMLNGETYNESVDIFSYGIVLCELIGRVKSDPDHLPRKLDYSPDFDNFSAMVPDCPPVFFNLAMECCRMDPDRRPAFLPIQMGLERLVVQSEEEMRDHPSNFFSLVLVDSPGAPSANSTSLQQMSSPPNDNRPSSR